MHIAFYYIVAFVILAVWMYLALKRNGIIDKNEFLLFLFGMLLWAGFAEMASNDRDLSERIYELLIYAVLAVAGVNLARNISDIFKRDGKNKD